ncbi:hypothetical protein [Zoogloea sp.]|uniref:hypothetical protein n=1 Tax=Zoogloea sp. TaxID=49181 RepID=UPI002639B002|nr:hypothetical protein [Zoogloea sp.]
MESMEQIELDRHRDEIFDGVKKLVEHYRSVFAWDIPEVDQARADGLILAEIRNALIRIENELPGS